MAADPSQPLFDPASVVALLDEPRLSDVRAAAAREAYVEAADKLEALLRDHPDDAEGAAWTYQLGLLRQRAGDPGAAARAFDRAAAIDWPLAPLARLEAGGLLVDIGEPAEALVRLAAIEPWPAIEGELTLARARALVAQRDVDAAAKLWDGYLAQRPRPTDWQLVALRYARALLQQPSVAHAERAVSIARLVMYESPSGRGAGEARELEQQALGTLPSERRRPFEHPEATELATRALALADSEQGQEALHVADRAVAELDGKPDAPPTALCRLQLARGKALGTVRRHSESSDAYGLAIERCNGLSEEVTALFLGGRAAARGGRLAEARRRYELLEQRFGSHRYADDARMLGAEAALELGDVAAFTRLLARVDEDYPEGDTVDDALFSLARARIEAADWAGAVQPLERALARHDRGRPYWAEGRPHYFLARARVELGQLDEGLALYERTIRSFPAGYYMVLAYDRLADHDEPRARRVLAEAFAAEPQGDFVIPHHAELDRPEFVRAVALVRQGEGARALAELDALGVRDGKADPAVTWASAFLLARIDAPSEMHGILRANGRIWPEHYPAGVWRNVWQLAFPRPFKPIVDRERLRSPIPEPLAYAIMREESAFKPRAVSSANAYGLMQLIEPTAQRMAGQLGFASSPEALKRPEVNIALGCRFLQILTRRFAESPLLAIPGYNAGPGNPSRWTAEHPDDDFDLFVERIPYRETHRYTKRVIASMAAYSLLYGAGMEEPLLRVPSRLHGTSDGDSGD